MLISSPRYLQWVTAAAQSIMEGLKQLRVGPNINMCMILRNTGLFLMNHRLKPVKLEESILIGEDVQFDALYQAVCLAGRLPRPHKPPTLPTLFSNNHDITNSHTLTRNSFQHIPHRQGTHRHSCQGFHLDARLTFTRDSRSQQDTMLQRQ